MPYDSDSTLLINDNSLIIAIVRYMLRHSRQHLLRFEWSDRVIYTVLCLQNIFNVSSKNIIVLCVGYAKSLA